MNLPRVHVIVTDTVVAQPSFLATCEAMLDRCGGDLAIHLRIRGMADRALLELAENIEELAIETDGTLIVNRRVDVALAAGADGVQLGRGSLPVEAVRSSVGDSLLIGASVHDLPAADTAKHGGADYLVVGSVFPTQSHPGLEPAGTEMVRAVSDTGLPVIGIGGVTAERAGQVLKAGAYGVAVISAVWSADDPVTATENLCEALAC